MKNKLGDPSLQVVIELARFCARTMLAIGFGIVFRRRCAMIYFVPVNGWEMSRVLS